MNGCLIITIAISKGISRQFMANNLLHHGRRACESRHFVDLDCISARLKLQRKQ